MNLEAMEAALRSTPFPELVCADLMPLSGPLKPLGGVKQITRRVANACDLTECQVLGVGQLRSAVLARCAIALVAHEGLGMSSSQIGRRLNNRHHTTILNALRRAKRLRYSDSGFAALLRVARGAL